MNWYLEAFRKYAVFEGRARRKEYWFFALFNFFAIAVLSVVDMLFGNFNVQLELGLLSGAYALVILIPSLSVSVRRLHDTGRSGWWALVNFLPLVGWIVMAVFAALDSEPGANRYGPNPKGVIRTPA